MKFLQNIIYLFLIVFLFSMLAKDFKDSEKQKSYNSKLNEAQEYINIKNDKLDELKKIVQTTINKTDSIIIYTNDTLINNINLFIKPNIKFENKPSSPLGQYEGLYDLYFPDPEKIKSNNKKIIDVLDSFIDYTEHYGFSVYHIDEVRNRNFKLTNNINDSSTYYSIAQFMYLNDKQKDKYIKRIENNSKDDLDNKIEKQIENLNKEFHNKYTVNEVELQNQKITNYLRYKFKPQLGNYKKSYYYFSCSNNNLNEEQFKQKVKLFESMFIAKKKNYLKGKIIKVKVQDFEKIETDNIKLSERKWMN